MNILAFIMWYMMGFGLIVSVGSVLTVPFYMIIKHGENNVSMYAVFAVVDAVLTLIASVVLLPNCNNDTFSGVMCIWFSIILIPTMIFCLIGAVVIDRITAYKNERNGEDE